MSLRVLAVSAPQFPAGGVGARALSSADPVSLYNACRLCAEAAALGQGPWGDSNFVGHRAARREATFLLHSADEVPRFAEQVARLKPNLVLIGAMSVCFPGAVACARAVKEILGDRVCVVLGGRHPSETVYQQAGGVICHHPGSPLLLMAQGVIPTCFDVVVSGDGEAFIRGMGELVADTIHSGQPAALACEKLPDLQLVPGRWVAGSVSGSQIKCVASRGPALPYGTMPSPAELFGVRTSFEVFGGRRTAQVFSDVGRGCIYDCQFCSERRTVTGAPVDLGGSPDRLFRNIRSAVSVIQEDSPGQGASAFVEDSTLLTFTPALVERFITQMEEAALDVQFGGQLTIDQILSRSDLLRRLREVGLTYLFVGLETSSPEHVGGISKDVKRKSAPWLARAESVMERLTDLGIHCGVAVLFGLGESHDARLALADQLTDWRARFRRPNPISMNWAVQHPLRGDDGGTGYTYTEWAVPDGPFLEPFRDFGEASVRYPLAGQPPPNLDEVRDVHRAFTSIGVVAN